jgi:hypothetical protein
MLARVWGKSNTHTLLVGISTTTMENSVDPEALPDLPSLLHTVSRWGYLFSITLSTLSPVLASSPKCCLHLPGNLTSIHPLKPALCVLSTFLPFVMIVNFLASPIGLYLSGTQTFILFH